METVMQQVDENTSVFKRIGSMGHEQVVFCNDPSTGLKAIIGVHLYGQPFDFDSVKAIADKHNIPLVEDAAQAQGAVYKGRNL